MPGREEEDTGGHEPMPDGAGEEELLSGRVQIVCVNAAKMKITSIPVELRTQLEALQ